MAQLELVVLNGPTIAAGESLSEAVDCSAGIVTKITTPTEWTSASNGGPAVLTFQTSTDGNGYNDIFDQQGNEVTCIVHGSNTAILVHLRVGWVKFRSGTRDHPVPQEDTRQFAIALDRGVGAAAEGTRKRPAAKKAPARKKARKHK
jgi:hypothetical protein